MHGIQYILQDLSANIANPTKGKYIVLLFRIAQVLKKNKFLFLIFFWYLLLYRIIVEWCMCVELSWNTQIGSGLQVYHGSGLVIHPKAKIGENCSIRQCTTIGVKQGENNQYTENAPTLGSNVDIGCNVVIIGNINIGNNVKIGAGSIVVKDIPDNCIVVGNPAKIISVINEHDNINTLT